MMIHRAQSSRPTSISSRSLALLVALGLPFLASCASTDEPVSQGSGDEGSSAQVVDAPDPIGLSMHELRVPTDDELQRLNDWHDSGAADAAVVRSGETAIPLPGFFVFDATSRPERIAPSMVELGDLTLLAVEPAAFTHADFDPDRSCVSVDDRGHPALMYTMREDRREAYGDWSESLVDQHTAIVVGVRVVAVPYFISRIAESGMLSGNGLDEDLESILAAIHEGR